MTGSGVRPADAAGLVLIRGPARTAEVLLGRRAKFMRFMPGVYAFPGGRVDPADRQTSGFDETLALPPAGIDQATRRRLVVFARAALRETFEETGLLVAHDAPAQPPAPAVNGTADDVWRAFAAAALEPAFSTLRLVARAVTPSRSPIRFHTRFFRAEGDDVAGTIAGSGELEDLRWVPAHETGDLPMSEVTRLVLSEALAHRTLDSSSERPAALFRWSGRSRRRPDRLEA